MRRPLPLCLTCLCVLLSLRPAGGQSTSRPLITKPISDAQLQTLPGNVHPMARPAFDNGAAPSDLPMERMLLVLKRSSEKQAALEALLASQQNPTAARYHKWLTPQQFGQQFGASEQDIQTITAWLEGYGFQVAHVANGRNVIEFSGTAGQVQQAFHTAIHKYVVNGTEHWANATNPQIPAALTPAVAGVATLHNFTKKSQIISHGQFQGQAGLHPEYTSGNSFALAPADYATIYNINPLYQAGVTGMGVTIAVVGRTDIQISDITSFRSNFGLTANNPQIVVNGPDPGDLGGDEESEAVLDTTWAGAVAPGAAVKLVVSKSTNTTDGVDLSEQYIIDNNLADVMTESFGACELYYSQGDATFYSSLAQQAAAEGITYTVAAGDSGAEGCDSPTELSATGGLSVNILAANPYVVAVGGTEFNEAGSYSTYWAASNAATTGASALSYIPEVVWNEACTPAECGIDNAGLWAGGGGASIYYTKPSWQTGVTGVPNDGARDVPDVSLTAAGHDFYLLCLDGSCTANSRGRIELEGYSGTSAATPSFAGIMALVVQKTGVRQGQADNVLYTLFASETLSACNGSSPTLPATTCIFHDVTVGNNAVIGETGYGTLTGLYQAGVGYDQATGLGSVNVTNLVNGWTGGSVGTPGLSVDQNALAFATENIGAAESLTFTVSNPGSGSLYLAAFAITQTATDFSFNKTCGTVLVAGESCQITVSFVPVGTGTRSGTLVVESTDGSLVQSISLTGVGIATATPTFTSTALSFGSQKVLTPGTPQPVVITNSTVAALNTSTLTVGGANPEDFTQLDTCPATLAPGGSCTLYVLFTPMLAGSRSGQIVVPLAGASTGQAITFTGTGLLTGLFEIVNSLTGKVLEVPNDSGTLGTAIQQNALNGGVQQQWQLLPTGTGSYAIQNVGTGAVLDDTAESTANGSLIQQWTYLGNPNQQWLLNPVDDVHYQIQNVLSSKVLDVIGGSSANGTGIQQWSYIGDPQQLWVLVPVGSYNINNGLSGFALDVAGGSSSDGTQIVQTTPSGSREQNWQLLPTGGGYFALLNVLTGKVLDDTAESTANGNLMQEYDYLGLANQQWQLVPVCPTGSSSGCLAGGEFTYQVVNRLSGKVLDDQAYSTTSGTNIQQWSYDGGANQQWQFNPVYYFNISNQLSGAVLDVTGGSTANGTQIQQWASDGFQQQQWQLVPAGGSYIIANNLTSKVLEVPGSATNNGVFVDQNSYTGGANQQWQVIPLANGYYEIQNSNSGLVLDVYGYSTANGAPIQQWTYLGGANQQWAFTPVQN